MICKTLTTETIEDGEAESFETPAPSTLLIITGSSSLWQWLLKNDECCQRCFPAVPLFCASIVENLVSLSRLVSSETALPKLNM